MSNRLSEHVCTCQRSLPFDSCPTLVSINVLYQGCCTSSFNTITCFTELLSKSVKVHLHYVIDTWYIILILSTTMSVESCARLQDISIWNGDMKTGKNIANLFVCFSKYMLLNLCFIHLSLGAGEFIFHHCT